MKNFRLYALLALLMMAGVSASAYDFYSVCPTGQKLGYIITSNDPPEVLLESMFDLQDYAGSVTIPETVSHNSVEYTVTAIGADAFNKGCFSNDLSGALVIPNKVRLIGPRAFMGCWFTGPLVIPNSVVSIGEWAFHNCKRFSSLTLSNSLIEINDNAFDLCENFRGDLIIPESVEYIGYNGFNECGFDGTLYLPSGMTLIDSGCIEACYNFSAINIPEGVTYIGYCAFEFLNKPTELELPSTVTEIESGAFRNLFRLTSMTVKASFPPYIWDDTFERVNRNIPVYIPMGTLEAYQYAAYWSEFTNFIEVELEDEEYIPFLQEGNEWYTLHVTVSSIYTYNTRVNWLAGDTLVDGVRYTKVMENINGVGVPYQAALLREENGKVWKTQNGDAETLLYDFAANVGDTLRYGDWAQYSYLVVDSISTEHIGGVDRKKFWLGLGYDFTGEPYAIETWIEGIGSDMGLLYSGWFDISGAYYRSLCFHQNGELIWQNPEYNACIVTSVEETEQPETAVYPNPGISTLNLRTALQNARVEVYDTNGRLIHSQALTENETAIDATDWAAGVYIWKVISNDKLAETGKWIKE